MDNDCDESTARGKMKCKEQEQPESEDESWDSEDDDETIARIQRAHFAQTAAMNKRKRATPRPRPMSMKRKMEAVKSFHNFTKKLKKDTGITIRSLKGNNMLDLNEFSSGSDEKSDTSDGLSEEEFEVNPSAVQELNDENESYIDPITGDFVEAKNTNNESEASIIVEGDPPVSTPKTLTISDIINEGDLDLTRNVEIAEVDQGELCSDKTAEELLDMKQDDLSQDFDIAEKLKEMGEISVKPIKKDDQNESDELEDEKKTENDDEKKPMNMSAFNVRRNIREVMDEKQLDASTLAAQRQESERLARVQEQQRLIREVQRQLAQNRQNNKVSSQRALAMLPGGSSILKKSSLPGQKLNNLPNTVLVKLPSGELKRTMMKPGQVEVTRVPKPVLAGPSVGQKLLKPEMRTDKKEVVEIVSSSSGEETSSSSSDSDDCIMLSDSEVPPSPEADEDPSNSGLHVNDAYNIPDEQGRVLINIGHTEGEEDIFLAPQIARVIKPHQIGGVRFLFDNIIESVERFSTSTGFGCILAHSMGLGKTLQIVCFCDIFLRHTKSKTVLCIMPINTLQNWVAEFNMWLPLDATNSPLGAHGEVRERNFPIYVLNDSHKTLQMRGKVVKDWTTTGGVLMIGYELYRLLSMKKDKKPRKKKKADAKLDKERSDKDLSKEGNDDTQGSLDNATRQTDDLKLEDKEEVKDDEKKEDDPTDEEKKLLDEMYEALVKPGPDLVICDEGHRIKNSHSNISYALKQMRTKRRVVLTGYPLQNNLLEYWCMVDFVRPNYLGSKTEFCNMFERPIQNGQCIDSTPQDIRLMRYRAHVLHSLLVGFVQRRSHAVLQSTLPQKAEYVLLIRMTPLQRKLYDRFMNEVVRSTSVPNPLKAFAICCKIWNHPDVLYNFLKKRSEANAAIEEDLDLEEIGGVTKSGRTTRSKAQPKKPVKPRISNKKGSSKKPAATIPPNTSSAGPQKPNPSDSNSGYGNSSFPPNGPYRPHQQPGAFPPYPGYQNPASGYYPPNEGYGQNYSNNYYPQQPPYSGDYPNQYPPNNSDCNNQTYNQNYWGNGNYYGNSEYYNNQSYPNNLPQEFRGNPPPDYNNSTQYPQQFNSGPGGQSFSGNIPQQYQNNQEAFSNQQRPPYPQGSYQNSQTYPPYNANAEPGPSYQNNQPSQNYPNQTYPPPYGGETYGPYNAQQFDSRAPNYPSYPNSADADTSSTPTNNVPNTQLETHNNAPDYATNVLNPTNEATTQNVNPAPYSNPYNYSQQSRPHDENEDSRAGQFRNYLPQLETKPPLNSPVTSWPLVDALKTEDSKLGIDKLDVKTEIKSESDNEVKIEDLDTKKIINDDGKEVKREISNEENVQLKKKKFLKDGNHIEKNDLAKEPLKQGVAKSDNTDSEEEAPKKNKKDKRSTKKKETKKTDKRNSKAKPKANAKSRKDRKTSKEKNDDSESEGESEKEKLSREEELALVKKAEEVTYDWAAELLKDYIPGIIENSAKMELFFFILNESITLGDRILLFSQSLFTLNLIEDFLEKNYIPGTNKLWERNTSYYRLDGSTHALEREKLINEFNANPNIYLFLVSTRAGSLGINLVGANRVIVFDSSWNPCHDTQAVCRVYRYGQKKPCFVYRFVMDWCLEKKIYDRQINKQGMADRVVDECNPDAVLSMKEITNLCFDNDEKESEVKDLSEHKDKYIDLLMQRIITDYGKLLSKEPFQHESLLVDRKEKKLSSAEKRLAQRGYELEKKAASAPKPTTSYRTVRTADGSLVQRPVASVRPMQHGARWIPADVWRRQGMTAQEMTLPLDVVIPTNSAEKTNIVLKAGQRVMVLKSPKGIYMQLESGKIIAIKTSFKMGQKGSENKDATVGKKILGPRPSPANLPGALKNNSAITVKPGPRPGLQRLLNRPVMGQNKMSRPFIPGQKFPQRMIGSEPKSYSMMRSKGSMPPGRIMRPNLSGSVSITKIPKDIRKPTSDSNDSTNSKMDHENSDDEAHVLDSEDDGTNSDQPAEIEKLPIKSHMNEKDQSMENDSEDSRSSNPIIRNKSNASRTENECSNDREISEKNPARLMTLTTDERFPSESALEEVSNKSSLLEDKASALEDKAMFEEHKRFGPPEKSVKMSLLKNYRHQRPGARMPSESTLSFLEKAASSVNNEGMPDFRKNLDDITQSYPTAIDDRPPSKSRKKKTPQKIEKTSTEKTSTPNPVMSHSVSSLLGSSHKTPSAPVAPMGQNLSAESQSRFKDQSPLVPHNAPSSSVGHLNQAQSSFKSVSSPNPPLGVIGSAMDAAIGLPVNKSVPPSALSPSHQMGALATETHPGYPAHAATTPENPYGQYPGYGMGYGGYPAAPYYGGYGGAGFYPAYPAAPHAPPHPYAQPAPVTTPPAPPEHYPPANPQW